VYTELGGGADDAAEGGALAAGGGGSAHLAQRQPFTAGAYTRPLFSST